MITTYTTQGPREYQEDQFFVSEFNGHTLLAVMDGHCGGQAAIWCHVILSNTVFVNEVNLELLCKLLAHKLRDCEAGTTLSIVHIEKDLATCAVIGDSPILIIDADGVAHISPEHNVGTSPNERYAVESRGGVVFYGRVQGRKGWLQLSRALGDAFMGRVISHEPEIYSIPLGPGSAVLVASDGVFDPTHTEMGEATARVVAQLRAGVTAQGLIESVGRLRDNATAVIWRPD